MCVVPVKPSLAMLLLLLLLHIMLPCWCHVPHCSTALHAVLFTTDIGSWTLMAACKAQ